MKMIMKVSAVAMMLGLASAAHAATYTFDFTTTDWGNNTWTRNGNALYVNDPGVSPNKRLRLTSSNPNQKGTAWFQTKLAVREAWSVSIGGQISHPYDEGADGIAFIFQTYGLNALPGSGSFSPTSGTGLGSEYLAINLNTWGTEKMQFYTKLGYSELVLAPGSLEGSFVFNLNASYNPTTQTLQYTYKRSGFADQTVTRTGFNMADRFPNKTYAYLGFWGGTGGSGENHDVRTVTINATAIPEPTTGFLVMAALGVLGLRRIRQIQRS